MKTESVTLLEWQGRFGTEEACQNQLICYRWPDGFICPHCGHDRGYYLPVHGPRAPGIGNGGYDFRGQQAAAGEMVLCHINAEARQLA